MFFAVTGFHKVAVGIFAFTRFLLDEQFEVELQIVHTSLNAKHFREERRFYESVFGIEVPEVFLSHAIIECPLDIAFLQLGIGMKLIAGTCFQQTDGMILKEILHALPV